MLTKTKIVLSALLVAGFASAAMASDASESQGRQTYTFVAQTAPSAAASAYAYAPANGAVKSFTAAEQVQFDRASQAALSQ